jgi:drug/metabolite transporter (DMT)-like permease
MSPLAMPAPAPRLAAGVLLFSASLWGLSWLPLKWFAAQGLGGPLVTLLAYGLVGLLALPLIWRQRRAWRAQWGLLLALVLVGGWANTSFVHALMQGEVVRVMFLFYLSPVWAVLGGWLFLKEHIPPLRWAAVGAALLGLWLFLGQDLHTLQFSASDLLALSAGLCFAANNVIARAAQQVPMLSKTFAVFVGCGLISLALHTGLGHGLPALPGVGWLALLAVLAYGGVWLLLATATWQFGVTHIESSRAGVILLAELVVAVLSAVWLGTDSLSAREWAGGTLIALAALAEAFDTRPVSPSPTTSSA